MELTRGEGRKGSGRSEWKGRVGSVWIAGVERGGKTFQYLSTELTESSSLAYSLNAMDGWIRGMNQRTTEGIKKPWKERKDDYGMDVSSYTVISGHCYFASLHLLTDVMRSRSRL